MVFVVAEIGVNWDGNLDLVKSMMESAKSSGCSAVKFQAYNKIMVEKHPQYERLMKSTITEKNIEIINQIAESIGIEWFCTPMYLEAVEMINPYVKRFKIRELDGKYLIENNPSNLVESIFKTKKQIIVSSQASPKKSKYYEDSRIKWLYCVPKYPCSLTDLHFENLKDFDGYSNHHPHVIAPLSAAILGAEIIEVHITSDKSKDFIDNSVSLDYQELNNLVSMINMAKKIVM